LPVAFNRFFNFLINKTIVYYQISFSNRDHYSEFVRNIRALIKYNLVLYQAKFTTVLEAYIKKKKKKKNNLSTKIYQLRRIVDKLIDIYAVLKSVVNYYLLFLFHYRLIIK
jgi:hypothetical protein